MEKTELKRILVIEDDPKHRKDAQAYFATQENVDISYARTYYMARDDLKVGGFIDGVISDVYFPLSHESQWDQPEPLGVRVAIELSQRGMPFVLNTAGYHHGRRYEWINQLAREQSWPLVDGVFEGSVHDKPGGIYENDMTAKDWAQAYSLLKQMMDATKKE